MQYQEYENERMGGRAMEGGGFFRALFDFSFTQFVTEKIIMALYILAIALFLLVVIVGVITAFTQGLWEGIIGLVFSPVVLLVYIVIVRVWLEFVVVVFRIADHTQETAVNTRKDQD
jgi:fatty acid desaturase